MSLLRSWGPVCGYAGLIFYLSSQPHPEETLPSFVKYFSDKALHVIEYSILGVLCYRALRGSHTISWRTRAIPVAILLTSLYGASDEVHQAFVPFRESSVFDWIADTIGAAISVVGISRFSPWGTSGDQEVKDHEHLQKAACTTSNDREA